MKPIVGNSYSDNSGETRKVLSIGQSPMNPQWTDVTYEVIAAKDYQPSNGRKKRVGEIYSVKLGAFSSFAQTETTPTPQQ